MLSLWTSLAILCIALVSKTSSGSISEIIGETAANGIRDILKTNQSKPSDVIRDKIVKLQAEFNKQKEDLSSANFAAYKSLLELLANVNDPRVNVQELKQKYEQLIKNSNLKIETVIAFYNYSINKLILEFKSENEVINEQVDVFIKSVKDSGCIASSKTKIVFQKCIQSIYNKFITDLSKSVAEVLAAADALSAVANDIAEYLPKELESFRNVKTEIEDEVKRVKQILNSESDYNSMRAARAFARVKELLKNGDRIATARTIVRNIPADAEATQSYVRETINKYVKTNVAESMAIVDSRVKSVLNTIENIKTNFLSGIDNIEQGFKNMEKAAWSMYEDIVSVEKVKERCKYDANFDACVDSSHVTFDVNFSSFSKEVIKLTNETLNGLLNKANNVIKGELTRVSTEAKNQAEEIIKRYKSS